MPRRKLRKFVEIKGFANVLEFPENLVSHWKTEIFQNNGDLVLELGCGRGAYTLALAKMNEGKNFVGIDRKGERIWAGAKEALNDELLNVRFLRIFIEKLDEFFDENEVSEIWITFPDPFPRDGEISKRRLTSSQMLKLYRKVLREGGVLNLKTDSLDFYEFSLLELANDGWTIFEKTQDLYAMENLNSELLIQTDYEKKFLALGKKICYLKAIFGS
jgi:tRNA (guanine-N7-)-methyltransferase